MKNNRIWTRNASVMRAGKYFYTANDSTVGRRVTVRQSPLSGRWLVADKDRELPATWATATEAKRYAEVTLEFGRFAPALPH